MWGVDAMPLCPTCKNNQHVVTHGFEDKHYGRPIVDLCSTYYIIGRQYKCNHCEEQKNEIERALEQSAEANDCEIEEVKYKYTFRAWDRGSLPYLPRGLGEEFPAFLTHTSGVDKKIVDMMRPLFDKGFRPEALSNLLLEMHAKEYTRQWLRHERDIAARRKSSNRNTKPEFSSNFADVEKYDGKVPKGSYLATVYKVYHESIRCHLSKEVKNKVLRDWLGMYHTKKQSICASTKEAASLRDW